jgi:hypothetical protein
MSVEENRVDRPILSKSVLAMAAASQQDFESGGFWSSLSHMGKKCT